VNDKAFLPPVPDMPYAQDDREYAKVAALIACYAARHGGVGMALELADMLQVPARSWEDARDLLAAERWRRIYGVLPHKWDGGNWTCLQCGQVHGDPCSCPCCATRQGTSGAGLEGEQERRAPA
jgi:rubrerythrin